ncbi:MAG TPA: chemotaxis protein [Thiolapillus brandeum]|uniref:Chemotaxis protein n=1 Tax=Thiolapillus brandeum TaxID=1076588 RepID=A0A831RW47_9GAMM|nr:chemotaxis protein [Thiolapillus brandeum]
MVARAKKGSERSAWVPLLSILLIASMIAGVSAFVVWAKHGKHLDKYILYASEQQVLAHRIAKYASEAASGKEASFARMQESRNRFSELLDALKNGQPSIGLPPSPDAIQPELHKVENAWLELRSHVDAILNNQDAILTVNEIITSIRDTLPDLLEVSTEVTNALVEGKATPNQIFYASRQLFLAQRINTALNDVLAGGSATALAVDQLTQDVDELKTVVDALVNGSAVLGIEAVKSEDTKGRLLEATAILGDIDESLGMILSMISNVLPALEAVGEAGMSEMAQEALAEGQVLPDMDVPSQLALSSDKVAEEVRKLIELYGTDAGELKIGGIPINATLVTALGILSAVLLVLLGMVLVGQARKREEATAEQYQRNQEAIRRLLDEMGDLADGDLSVQATVTEDITGAIADSINYAIEAMREVVESINQTTEEVSGSAQDTQATIMHLADAAEHQREQISGASSTIDKMTVALQDMSNNATESAQVAENSVELAAKGGEAVRRTINGMDNIREQIQETSKRIKRLGESSQEIGNIVELIEDIADQTNILALNAAMQAAMAGEAGRGFAVVADEVQRLAERSANATKQIEALVQTIQADTNEAVSSMEASTTEVVGGAGLAEDAGSALQEIEKVSNEIAGIITKLADSAQQESAEARQLNDTMGVIQEITQQTTDGTANAAAEIGELAEKTNRLRQSVAGFVLPEKV